MDARAGDLLLLIGLFGALFAYERCCCAHHHREHWERVRAGRLERERAEWQELRRAPGQPAAGMETNRFAIAEEPSVNESVGELSGHVSGSPLWKA